MQKNGNSLSDTRRKKAALDGGKISLYFRGNVNLNALGTTLAIGGVMVMVWLLVCGIFIIGKG